MSYFKYAIQVRMYIPGQMRVLCCAVVAFRLNIIIFVPVIHVH